MVNATGRVLIVDETRKCGPLGDAAFQVLLSERTIFDAARRLLARTG